MSAHYSNLLEQARTQLAEFKSSLGPGIYHYKPFREKVKNFIRILQLISKNDHLREQIQELLVAGISTEEYVLLQDAFGELATHVDYQQDATTQSYKYIFTKNEMLDELSRALSNSIPVILSNLNSLRDEQKESFVQGCYEFRGRVKQIVDDYIGTRPEIEAVVLYIFGTCLANIQRGDVEGIIDNYIDSVPFTFTLLTNCMDVLLSDLSSSYSFAIQHSGNNVAPGGIAATNVDQRGSIHNHYYHPQTSNSPSPIEAGIQRLKDFSSSAILEYARHHSLSVQTKRISIQRHCFASLRSACEKHSALVVIGEPGYGKTAALQTLANNLSDEGKDIVFLPVERFTAKNEKELSDELRLDDDFSSILRDWEGTETGFLIIDAMDAARNESTASTFQQLIQRISSIAPRWHIVISIRTFDLRYNRPLQRLFLGSPPDKEFCKSEFSRYCHIAIPNFSENELQDIGDQSRELGHLLESASPKLLDLIRVPFNMMLVGELLAGGTGSKEIEVLTTQSQLLDLYWLERVVGTGENSDQREQTLRNLVQLMVDAGVLRAKRKEILSDISYAIHLQNLLKLSVVVEYQDTLTDSVNRDVITFSHHILFDYAVCRLLLDASTTKLFEILEETPERLFFLRPSFRSFFELVWDRDGSSKYWELVISLQESPKVSELAKSLGPQVAVSVMHSPEEFTHLVENMELDESRENWTAADKIFSNIVNSIRYAIYENSSQISTSLWEQIIDNIISQNPRNARILSELSRMLFLFLSDEAGKGLVQDFSIWGKVARFLFHQAKESGQNERVAYAVVDICKTIESDPVKSVELLNWCLHPENMSKCGYLTIPKIAREIESLFIHSPIFVSELIKAIVTFEGFARDERTSLGQSKILPMSSNKMQDFESAKHSISSIFSSLIHIDSIKALDIVFDVVENAKEVIRLQTNSVIDIEWRGNPYKVVCDGSYIWDCQDRHRHDFHLELMDKYFDYLDNILKKQQNTAELQPHFKKIIEAKKEVFFRWILRLGKRHPVLMAQDFKELAWQKPFLLSSCLQRDVCSFISAITPELSNTEKERMYDSIFQILPTHEAVNASELDSGTEALYFCVYSLVNAESHSDETRVNKFLHSTLLQQLFQKHTRPNLNESMFSVFDESPDVSGGPEKQLESKDFDTFRQHLRNLKPVYEATGRTKDEFLRALSENFSLCSQALESLMPGEVGKENYSYAWLWYWEALGDSLEKIKEAEWYSLDSANEVASIYHEAFSAFPKNQLFVELWRSQHVRYHYAYLLRHLFELEALQLPEWRDLIDGLLVDSSVRVRRQALLLLINASRLDTDYVWEKAQTLVERETNSDILILLYSVILSLWAEKKEVVWEATQEVHGKARNDTDYNRNAVRSVSYGAGPHTVREAHSNAMIELALVYHHKKACEQILSWIESPLDFSEELSFFFTHTRDFTNVGDVANNQTPQDMIRSKTIKLWHSILESIEQRWSRLTSSPSVLSPTEQEELRLLIQLSENASRTLYFASGAYERTPLENNRRVRFFQEWHTTLSLIAQIGFPAVVHYIVESLESFLPEEPKKSFLIIEKAISFGKDYGYQNETLALTLCMKLLYNFLSEHRQLVQDDQQCQQALLRILNVFSHHPETQKFVFELDSLFR